MKYLYLCQTLAAVFCLGTITSCAGSGSGGSSSDTSAISKQYHVVDNGCDSGVQTFSGTSQDQVLQAYCEALQDENRNRDHNPQKATINGSYCPTGTREILFEENCTGTFRSHYPDSTKSSPQTSNPNLPPAPSQSTPPKPTEEPKPTVNQTPTLLKNAKSLEEITRILGLDLPDNSSRYNEPTLKAIAQALESQFNLIESSKNISQQKLLMYFVEYRLSLYSEILAPLCEAFMKSPDEALRTEAAAIVIKSHPENSEAILMIRNGTQSKNADIRYESISALGSYSKMTPNDRVIIINAVSDSDQDTRNNANSIAESMTFGAEMIPALSKLMMSANADVRYYGSSLLGKIEGSSASHLLISHLEDSDQDTRNNINSILEQRTLSINEIDGLARILNSQNADSRYYASSLVGKIEGQKATDLLISHLDDKDQDTRNNINSILEQRNITIENLTSLAIQAKSGNADTRYYADSLIGKVNGSQATILLVGRLSDPDQDARNNATSILDQRNMTEDILPALIEQLNSSLSDARYAAASLIGKLNSKDGKAALKRRLQVEKNQDVANEINSTLQND